MLDLGWPELLLILAVAVFVTRPDDIPGLLYNAGRMVRRLQYLRYSMSEHFERFMREQDLDEIRRAGAETPDDYDDTGEDAFLQPPDARDPGENGEARENKANKKSERGGHDPHGS